MDYEKKYNEALDRAKEALESGSYDKETIEYIFPELKEDSEDYRIRKNTISIVRNAMNGSIIPLPLSIYNESIAWLEKQGEAKSTEKVEPKFKIGDWIFYSADNCEGVRHITKIDEKGYYIERNGYPHGIIPFKHEIYMKLWTIEDAKDGDVLADDEEITGCPFIFHYLTEERNPRSYCGVDTSGHFQVNDKNGEFWCSSYKVQPATKEQRDLLFQKMKEAGYEWDADTKTLKKL